MSLLLGVLDHYLRITQDRINRRLKLLAHVCKKHPLKSIVFIIQRRGLHNIPQFNRERLNAYSVFDFWLSVNPLSSPLWHFSRPLFGIMKTMVGPAKTQERR